MTVRGCFATDSRVFPLAWVVYVHISGSSATAGCLESIDFVALAGGRQDANGGGGDGGVQGPPVMPCTH